MSGGVPGGAVRENGIGTTDVGREASATGSGPSKARLPIEPLVAVLGLWAVIGVLWSGRYLKGGGLIVFLMAATLVVVWVGRTVVEVSRKDDLCGSVERALLFVAFLAVPALFDLSTADGFNLVKFTVTAVLASVLAAVWIFETLRVGRRRRPNPFLWPVLGLTAWTATTAALAPNPRLSLLGAYYSYDGLLATLAFVVIFFAIARAFSMEQVHSVLSVLYFGAGGLVALYGSMQLHDRLWPGSQWDWVNWGDAVTFSATANIWSSFGNPNHLGGFLSMMLPIGIVLATGRQRWWTRSVTLVIVALMVVELLKTEARGAWLGAAAGLVLVILLLLQRADKLPRTKRVPVGLTVVAVAVAAVAGLTHLGAAEAGGMFDVSTDSIAAQRVEFWKAAARMANDHRLTGVGPDGYESFYFAYSSPKIARLFGPDTGTNGAHNVFMNVLATQGYPGLGAFVLLLGFAFRQARRAWRSLGAVTKDYDDPNKTRGRDTRPLLAAVAGGIVAYIVQASFNVQQIGLTFVFWVLLGLLSVVATGVVATEIPATSALGHAERSKQGKATWARAALAVALMVFAVALVIRPYRADRSYNSYLGYDAAAQAEATTWPGPAREQALHSRSRSRLAQAVELNPWEPFYLAVVADGTYESALKLPNGSDRQLEVLNEARSQYEQVISLAPRTGTVLERYAEVLLAIDQFDQSGGNAERGAAIAALRKAVRLNPLDTRLTEKLQQVIGS